MLFGSDIFFCIKFTRSMSNRIEVRLPARLLCRNCRTFPVMSRCIRVAEAAPCCCVHWLILVRYATATLAYLDPRDGARSYKLPVSGALRPSALEPTRRRVHELSRWFISAIRPTTAAAERGRTLQNDDRHADVSSASSCRRSCCGLYGCIPGC